jgi:multisubunit Na+/H+ antiporter MnhE subunit
MAFWVIVDDSVALDELLAGAGAAALGALLVEVASYQAAVRFRIRLRWLARAVRLPGQVAGDTVTVFVALWKRLARGEEPPSGFVTEPVSYGADTAEGKLRRALLVGARSLAPNTFVVGIDADTDVLVLHQLVRDEARP